MILTTIAFIFVLGILILVHEFGHFIAAKKSGVKVEEFSIGFPPRLFSFKRGETRYTIGLFPVGGYVKMLGELEPSKDSRAFENQSPRKRFIISVAGVLMNFVLAWLILTIGFSVGMTPLASPAKDIPGKKLESSVIVAEVLKDSPAEKMGLQQKDILLFGRVPGDGTTNFNNVEDLSSFTRQHLGEEIVVGYDRSGVKSEKAVTISSNPDSPLGVSIIEKTIVQVPWYKAPWIALRECWRIIETTFKFFGILFASLFKEHKVSEGVGGPVAIYVYTGLAVRAGLMVFAQFIALISLSLATINILPIPALDGGRVLFIILERFFGRRIVKEQVENIIHTIGFALLLVLIGLITYHDVIKYFVK